MHPFTILYTTCLVGLICLLGIAVQPVDAQYVASGIDENRNTVPGAFFLCDNYRSCFTNFKYVINYTNVNYVCFMPEAYYFMTGIQYDGKFESIGMNYERNIPNGTLIYLNSFVKIFNHQLLNFGQYHIDRICIKYQ